MQMLETEIVFQKKGMCLPPQKLLQFKKKCEGSRKMLEKMKLVKFKIPLMKG